MRPAAVVIVPLFALAIVSAIVVWRQHEDDASFVVSQQGLRRVTVEDVERTMRDAPDPATNRPSARVRVDCAPGPVLDELRNPWDCRFRYPTGLRPRYLITIAEDGSYVGQRKDEPGRLEGCCVEVPRLR
ncbi:MAG: hypothetical protein M3320_08410 [Actinomycetota bacterium]|nr:hypothetical protein [Actinomycetota bacterium]MDQ5808682.1 hypothetical protein [Actinomycetota bacterium]